MKASDDERRTEKAWNNPNYVAEVKWDGVRFLNRKELDGSVHITSRQKSKKTLRPVDKTDNFPHLVKFTNSLPNGTILDGEVVIGGDTQTTSSEVTKITGALPEKAIARQKKNGWVHYVTYDILYYNGTDVTGYPWWSRRQLLEKIVEEAHNEYVHLSVHVPCNKDNNKSKEFYESIVANGGEGVILKDINAPYKPDKRPLGTWLKVKKYSTFDVVVMGFTDAEVEYTGKELDSWKYWEDSFGNKIELNGKKNADVYRLTQHVSIQPVTKYHYYGWIGAVRFGQYDKEGNLVEVGQTSGMDEKDRAWFTENKESAIGIVIEVGAMERIKDSNALRHPRFIGFRQDKNPTDCVIGEC